MNLECICGEISYNFPLCGGITFLDLGEAYVMVDNLMTSSFNYNFPGCHCCDRAYEYSIWAIMCVAWHEVVHLCLETKEENRFFDGNAHCLLEHSIFGVWCDELGEEKGCRMKCER